jgi:RHS repeat-associated protein
MPARGGGDSTSHDGRLCSHHGIFPLVSRTDEENFYDNVDRLERRKNTLGDEVKFEYDPRGRLVQTTSPLGHVTEREYDDDGNLTRLIDPSGAEQNWSYDPEGRVIAHVNPVGLEIRTSYDAEGRAVLRWTELSQNGAFDPNEDQLLIDAVGGLDPEGNPTLVKDGEANEFHAEFDALGRQIKSWGPLQAEATAKEFKYDYLGRLLQKTDPNDHSMSLTYDALGRVKTYENALGRRTTFDYDEVGSLITRTGPDLAPVAFEYDRRGLLTRRTTPQESTELNVEDIYRYDSLGRPILAKNAVTGSWYHIEYDDLDRPISIYEPSFGTARRRYDKDGRLTGVVYPDNSSSGFPEGVVVAYNYDPRGLLSSIVDPVAGAWRFDYDAAGRLTRQRDASGFQREVSYTARGLVDRVDLLDGNRNLVERFEYDDYDALGNPRTIRSAPVGGIPQEFTQIFYDPMSRVERVVYPGASIGDCGQAEVECFGYDLAGNRTSHTDRSGSSTTYHYDPADQLQEIQDANGDAILTFAYDDRGRRIEKSDAVGVVTQYNYDRLDRLRSYTPPPGAGSTTSLTYDALGHRNTRAKGGQVSRYFGEWVEERNGQKVRLVHGGGIDNVLAEVVETSPDSFEERRLYQDGIANVSYVVTTQDAGGPTVSSQQYEAFGTVRVGGLSIERGFAGRPVEGDTGLIYMRARHYDPLTGQFLQTDPLGVNTTQLYAYAENNPYVFTDPTGLASSRNVQGGPSTITASFSPSQAGSTFQSIAGGVSGLAVGAFVGVNTAPYVAAAFSACGPICWVGAGALAVGAVGYDAYQGFPAFSSYWNSLERTRTGNATFSESFNTLFPVGAVLGGAGSGFATLPTRGTPNLSTLHTRGFRPPAGTRSVPEGVPDAWRIRPTRGEGGVRYYDPQNPGNAVRVMPGNANSPYPNSQAPYVRWQRNGQALDRGGNAVPNKAPEPHIPLQQFRFDPWLFK